MDALMTSVLRLQEQGLTVKAISARLGISEQKTRKILITVGAWSSPTSLKIQQLKAEGKSLDEISEAMKMTRNAIISYLPYKKGMQNAEYPTINAQRIRACRAKKKQK